MRRTVIALSLAAATMLAVAAPASAATKNKCAKFKGKTVFSNSQMRILKGKVPHGDRLIACDRRNGKGRLLGQNQSGNGGSQTVKLLTAKTHFAGVRQAYSGPFGAGESTTVVNVRTARYYDVADWSISDVILPGPPARATKARSFKLASDGRSAAVLAVGSKTPTFDQTATAVTAYEANGDTRILDSGPQGSIPAASLSIAGGFVNWTKLGLPYSAPL